MASPADIHEVLKGYLTIVAKAGGTVPLDPALVKEFNLLGKNPKDVRAHKRLHDLLAKFAKVQKAAKSSLAPEIELLAQAAKLAATGGDKMEAVLSRIKPEPEPEPDEGKPEKLQGTDNQIVKVLKSAPFVPKAEQGDLALRSVLVKLAINPDLKKAADKDAPDDDKKQMEDDKAQWGVARRRGKMILAEDNAAEFTAAAPRTIWLGYVRIGERVERHDDRLVLVQLSPEEDSKRRFLTKPQALVGGQTWHTVWLNKHFSAKSDPGIKEWNGWTLQDLKADKRLALSDTGCFFGFYLLKATERGMDHYWNFRCPSLNKPANALVAENVPDMPPRKMNADQRTMYQNMITAARGKHEVPTSEIAAMFPGVALHRATLGLEDASKKLPLSWAKAVFEAITKLSR